VTTYCPFQQKIDALATRNVNSHQFCFFSAPLVSNLRASTGRTDGRYAYTLQNTRNKCPQRCRAIWTRV